MRKARYRSSLLTGGVLMCAAAALALMPPRTADTLRALVFDATLPGHRLLDWGYERFAASLRATDRGSQVRQDEESGGSSVDLSNQLRRLRQEARRLRIENGLLREKLQQADRVGVSPYTAAQTAPLVVPELIGASVLAGETAEKWRLGLLIDEGASGGVRESALVLADDGLLLDQGRSEGLKTGQPVFLGASVLGKIDIVGRWTSTVRRVTDEGFRGKARLARRMAEGIRFGPRAVLVGTGERLCRLMFVSADEPVRVGDEVYTDHEETGLPWPFLYGTVVEAELPAGAMHWQIRVEPAAGDVPVRTVQVLTRKFNPVRRLAQ